MKGLIQFNNSKHPSKRAPAKSQLSAQMITEIKPPKKTSKIMFFQEMERTQFEYTNTRSLIMGFKERIRRRKTHRIF